MSDFLKHECGIAAVRLLKPLAYYQEKYGTSLWGFNKLFLLMEKQHNRGHDGVGIGCTKLNMPIGQPYVFRRRDASRDSLSKVFRSELKSFNKLARKGVLDPDDPESVKSKFNFGGEILVGHLRYGTSGLFDEGSCHPYLRRSNWPTRTLMVMGNFNMTNAGALNQRLIERGQHPIFGTDTQTVLEEVGFHLDEAHTDLYRGLREEGIDGKDTPDLISEKLDIDKLISESAEGWDGGYTITGVVGNGDMFVMRDPNGIRPCHVLINDEVIAFASERVPLMTVFESEKDDVRILPPGGMISIKADGKVTESQYTPQREFTPCSFERIYFSRGNDPDIYQERKEMGAALVPQVMKELDGDCANAVFSFVPNTAETAYYGLMDGLRVYRREQVKEDLIKASEKGALTEEIIDDLILRNWPRGEKIAHKDIKMRTFISQENDREKLVSHVYDITYDVVKPTDALVVLDDSIVRGTTLKKSILRILTRTNPKKIVICSTAPQIRYPDCYGIDMSELGKFIAFQATINLLKRDSKQSLIDSVYEACLNQLKNVQQSDMVNCVKAIYDPYTPEEISEEIGRMVSPEDGDWKGDVSVVFQTIEDLHKSIPGPSGDWYFTGDYPTAGGNGIANLAFVKWYDGTGGRSYDLPL